MSTHASHAPIARQDNQHNTQLQLSSSLDALVISYAEGHSLSYFRRMWTTDMDMDLPPKPILSRKVSDFFAIKCMENCVYYYTTVFVSVRFCFVPFCVPFFVCCSLGNSEKKTEMHLFIAGQHAMQACRAARQAN